MGHSHELEGLEGGHLQWGHLWGPLHCSLEFPPPPLVAAITLPLERALHSGQVSHTHQINDEAGFGHYLSVEHLLFAEGQSTASGMAARAKPYAARAAL